MSKIRTFAVHVALIAGWLITGGQAADQNPAESREGKLIAVLQSDAAPNVKAITCKQLAICGTAAAVPALAALLSDEKLASWARIGLEAIPDPAVDAALREALGKLQGKLLIGVINSIGKRRDTKTVEWLSGKLKDADPALASAAAAALGRIGGEPAVQALEQALAGASAAMLPAICEGCLRCADRLIGEGRHDRAAAICERVRGVPTPRHIRMEATRSLIVARQAAGIPLLIEQLKSDDAGMVAVALGLAHDLPGAELTKALVAEVAKLPPDKQRDYFALGYVGLGDSYVKNIDQGQEENLALARKTWQDGLVQYPKSEDLKKRLDMQAKSPDAIILFVTDLRSLKNPVDTDLNLIWVEK